MATISDTAYPQLENLITAKSQLVFCVPTNEEIRFVRKKSFDISGQLTCLLMLKCFQRLGYFPRLSEVPDDMIKIVSNALGLATRSKQSFCEHDSSAIRQRQRTAILKLYHIKAFSKVASNIIHQVMQREINRKDDLVDLINVAIEELARNHYELPGFTSLMAIAQEVRAKWSELLFEEVECKLTEKQKKWIDEHLEYDYEINLSFWQAVKTDPGNPTLTQLRNLIERYKKLSSAEAPDITLVELSRAKLERFSAEAKTLDIYRMRRIKSGKRYTLALCLFHTSRARALDDLGEMLIKRIRKMHTNSEKDLQIFRENHQRLLDDLIMKLGSVAKAVRQSSGPRRKISDIVTALGKPPQQIEEECELFTAYTDNNSLPFAWKHLQSHRTSLIDMLQVLELKSTSEDQKVIQALKFLLKHANTKEEWIEIYGKENGRFKIFVDMSIIPLKWWKCVTGLKSRKVSAIKVHWKHFEACLFSLLSDELQSGDIAILGGDRFSDYRSALVDDTEYLRKLSPYAKSVGMPVDRPRQFVIELRECLRNKILLVDQTFPENTSLRFENDLPFLSKAPRKSDKKRLSKIEEAIRERLEHVTIIDVLADTHKWLKWSQYFKPVSGQGTRIKQPDARYIATVFCYGCGLGPTQTARSLKDRIDKNQISWVHHHHVSEGALEKSISKVISAYQKYELPVIWGSGKHVSADGTKWEVGSKNLLSEYHIRYGGYGGIGYYHVSDTYIALFSRFIPCGVWEAVYILDGLLSNESEIKPDTVHGDTQAQNTPVFGLSHLLGINLMPRIRNWKDLKLFRPSRLLELKNLNSIISDEIIDWHMIEQHMPDMMRIVLAIQAGKLVPSTILRKLSSKNKKNRLYFAFRELGRAIRTMFLLDFIVKPDLRATIQSCTNKSEAFNDLISWLDFGGAGLKYENDRDEQRRLIKYNHLAANLVILYNVQALTKVLNEFADEGT